MRLAVTEKSKKSISGLLWVNFIESSVCEERDLLPNERHSIWHLVASIQGLQMRLLGIFASKLPPTDEVRSQERQSPTQNGYQSKHKNGWLLPSTFFLSLWLARSCRLAQGKQKSFFYWILGEQSPQVQATGNGQTACNENFKKVRVTRFGRFILVRWSTLRASDWKNLVLE